MVTPAPANSNSPVCELQVRRPKIHRAAAKGGLAVRKVRVCAMVDITDRVQFEARQKELLASLLVSKNEAEEANQSKTSFLANMSHEIRTPLAAIIGFSQIMADKKISEKKRREAIEVIKRNGDLLSTLINDILDLSKVEAGKLEIERSDMSLVEIVKNVKAGLTLRAKEKGIQLSLCTEGVVPKIINTDPLRLQQILLNVVGNAIKFTDIGEVKVTISLCHDSAGTLRLKFVVKDSGVGIGANEAKKIFDPFTQADSSINRKFGGTGLGLSLSKKLANALGGDVTLLESHVNTGSTFMITIDPGKPKNLFSEKDEATSRDEAFISDGSIILNGLRILLVDDSEDNREIVQYYLNETGAVLDFAVNGKEGVEKAIAGNYRLVLMDLQMPIMDGYKAVRELRRRGYSKPIIALTAHAMKEVRKRTIESGFDDHLPKPIDRELLLHLISKFSAENYRRLGQREAANLQNFH